MYVIHPLFGHIYVGGREKKVSSTNLKKLNYIQSMPLLYFFTIRKCEIHPEGTSATKVGKQFQNHYKVLFEICKQELFNIKKRLTLLTRFESDLGQGCQMVYLQSASLVYFRRPWNGKFWCISWQFGVLRPFFYIFLKFCTFFPVLVCFTKNNLATPRVESDQG
jgi:hypothetical protein